MNCSVPPGSNGPPSMRSPQMSRRHLSNSGFRRQLSLPQRYESGFQCGEIPILHMRSQHVESMLQPGRIHFLPMDADDIGMACPLDVLGIRTELLEELLTGTGAGEDDGDLDLRFKA